MAEDRELLDTARDWFGCTRKWYSSFPRIRNGDREDIGFPAIIRPAFTLGGTGGGIAYNIEEYRDMIQRGSTEPSQRSASRRISYRMERIWLEVMRDELIM